MSSANVDLVRSLFQIWERGEFISMEWADPEIEFTMADGPEPGTRTGVAGMAEGWGAFQGAWEGFRADPTDYHELDHEHVLVLLHFIGRAKASGMDLTQMQTKQASPFQIRRGKVKRLVLYWDEKRALADLGLAPERPSTG
jgi:ketosteroid isomerase-like protein